MTPPRDPREPRETRRDAGRDEAAARPEPASRSEREEQRRLVEQEREAYERERGARRRAERARAAGKPRRPRLRLPRPSLARLSRPKPRPRKPAPPTPAGAGRAEPATARPEKTSPARPQRRRTPAARPGLQELRSASVGGLRATAGRLGPAAARIGRGLRRAAALAVVGLLRLFALAERAVCSLAGAAAAAGGRAVAFLERRATPERVLLGVTAAAAACLAASQFVDYRGVDVGRPGYSDVSSVAPPPQVGLDTAGQAHAYILLPVAAIALVLAAVAVLRRRWRLGRLVAAAGAAGILVSLAIDLPQGLDAGTAGVAFAGAKATMKEGFYVQLVSSAVLVGCGLLLGQYLQGAKGTARRHGRERPARTRRAPSVAGGGA